MENQDLFMPDQHLVPSTLPLMGMAGDDMGSQIREGRSSALVLVVMVLIVCTILQQMVFAVLTVLSTVLKTAMVA